MSESEGRRSEPEGRPAIDLPRLHYNLPVASASIRSYAKRLNLIVDAWEAGVGGPEGVPYLLADAIRAAEELRTHLTEWCRVYGVTRPPRLPQQS